MDNFNIIQNDDANTAKVIDAKVKNKWSWSWLEKKIVLDIKKILPKSQWTSGPVETILGDFTRKV